MDYTEEINNWEPFHNHFHLRIDTVSLYTRKVQDICSDALKASNIRHPPITSRIKSWQSAKGSVNRRNQERIIRRRIRNLVESQGRRWEDYTHETGLSLYGEETEPFKSPEEMFAALHDFGGIRIALYFPGDIERVAAVINEKFTVIRQVEKGHSSQANAQSLEDRLELLQNSKRQTPIDTSVLQRSMRTFRGYKATHFVVKLRDEHIGDSHRHAWTDIVVEIQVGTLVMHVWSEIEHDMIYKPLDSQDAGVSEDEKRILDLINGIVLTGEAALRQLEASTAQRLNRRAEDENAMASSHYELATWIEKYFKERKIAFKDTGPDWRHLEQLFTILKVTGSHKHSEVTRLIQDATQRTLSRHLLPTEILWALARERTDWKWPGYFVNPRSETAQIARLWALHLVHSTNLAKYLGVTEEFLRVDMISTRPSIITFLDILHPGQPYYLTAEIAEHVISFCKSVVSLEHRKPETSNNLVKAAINLPVTQLVASFVDSISCTIPLPAIIVRLFTVEDDVFDDTDEIYRLLDLIDVYVSSDGNRDDLMVIWDSLTAQSRDLTKRKPTEDRLFIPVTLPGKSPFGHWKLVDHIVTIDKVQVDGRSKLARSPTAPQFSGPEMFDPDDVLQLAYRLHPKEKWDRVRSVWKIIKSLRRQRQSLDREDKEQATHWVPAGPASAGPSLAILRRQNQLPLAGRSHPYNQTPVDINVLPKRVLPKRGKWRRRTPGENKTTTSPHPEEEQDDHIVSVKEAISKYQSLISRQQ